MDHAPLRSGAFVTGGLFLGLWLFLGLFKPSMLDLQYNVGYWWFWGFVGLLLAGGIFAGRVSNANVRIAIWVSLGIAVGMLVGAALFNRIGEAVAALFTAGGGAIIVTALPGMAGDPVPPQAWSVVDEEMPTQAPRGRRSS